ncbi:hypothetical protein SDRG_11076 [Saprolegnia diclina VS20]|uniref:Uncharacterized protein n=1 Tax=Saprolegnia diclina (strain VS20) TaxID=1156394 RepID=T0RFT4_SAPDV|nr:hypothetical protein SDRG_11076 [Saprolegnia diclina VS20]EQC31148.1 hypothetical protein SDRG_11076 [Saprolegnia diclina VS20]|eukprot:XP_008615321.1 hypothetical protein SDRG_11076 [Saprolegnia diclina VS20]
MPRPSTSPRRHATTSPRRHATTSPRVQSTIDAIVAAPPLPLPPPTSTVLGVACPPDMAIDVDGHRRVLSSSHGDSVLTHINAVDVGTLSLRELEAVLARTRHVARTLLLAPPTRVLTIHGCFGNDKAPTTTYVPVPVQVVDVSCGAHHLLLRTRCGDVFAYGRGESGRLGLGDTMSQTTPTRISTLPTALGVACGRDHSVVVCTDGRAFAFGWGEGGRLGLGIDAGDVLTPTRVLPAKDTTEDGYYVVGAGRESTLLVSHSGQLFFCGVQHLVGENGQETTQLHLRPSPVTCAALDKAVIASVKAGDAHYMLLTTAGDVYTWGLGASGALGTGTYTTINTPTRVVGLPKVTKIAAGPWQAAAVAKGAAYVWGDGLDCRPTQESCVQAPIGDVACTTTTTFVVAHGVVHAMPRGMLPPALPSSPLLLAGGGDYVCYLQDSARDETTTQDVVG